MIKTNQIFQTKQNEVESKQISIQKGLVCSESGIYGICSRLEGFAGGFVKLYDDQLVYMPGV